MHGTVRKSALDHQLSSGNISSCQFNTMVRRKERNRRTQNWNKMKKKKSMDETKPTVSAVLGPQTNNLINYL